MDLKTWMKKNDHTIERFAAAIGCTSGTIFKWFRGDFKPSKAYMRMIDIYTKGQVKEKDFNIDKILMKKRKEFTNVQKRRLHAS